MIMAILYVFLVHVIIRATAESRSTSNETRKSLSIQNNTYHMNAFGSNETNKECRLAVNETDLFFLKQLARSKVVHISELHLHFASNISNSIIKKWIWRMTNNVGKEILSVLAMGYTTTWTLNAGIRTAKINILDDPPGCIRFEKEPGDLIAGAILKQLFVTHEKEICFSKVRKVSTQTRCCQNFIGKDPFKYQCYGNYAGSEFVNVLESILSVYHYFISFCGFTLVVYLGSYLQWGNTSDTNYRRFYKLTESPMSMSSILFMLCWDGYGMFKSSARKCLLIVISYLFLFQIEYFKTHLSVIYFSLWVLTVPFFDLNKVLPLSNNETRLYFCLSRRLLKVFSYLSHDIQDVFLSARVNALGVISLLTLPFNIKRLKKSVAIINSNTEGSFLKDKVLLCSKTGVLCLLYIPFIFILQVVFIFLYAIDSYSSALIKRIHLITVESNQQKRSLTGGYVIFYFDVIFMTFFSFIFVFALFHAPLVVIPLLSGLILNVAYFFPYIVYISIVIFYSCIFWTSVEHQYAVLLRLIFDDNLSNNKDHNDDVDSNSNIQSNNKNNSNNNGSGINDNSSSSGEGSTTTNNSNVSSNNDNSSGEANTTTADNNSSSNNDKIWGESSIATTSNNNSNNANSNGEDSTSATINNNNGSENSNSSNNGSNDRNHNNDSNGNDRTINISSNNSNNGDHDQGTHENAEIVCVVSKELYNDVRERLLPYHGNLFRFVMNVFGITLFAYITLTLVRVLQVNNVSPTVQLLTTFSVSAFPYIMNTVTAKKDDEQKNAWKEQLKHRVKPLVNKLTVDKPDLRRTQLIVRHELEHHELADSNWEQLRESLP